MKKCWYQQKSRDVSRVLYIFLDLLQVRYKWTKFHDCRICVTDLGRGPKRQLWATPKLLRPILNRVNRTSSEEWHPSKIKVVYVSVTILITLNVSLYPVFHLVILNIKKAFKKQMIRIVFLALKSRQCLVFDCTFETSQIIGSLFSPKLYR